MAILRSLDGKFFEVPDEQLKQYEMSDEKVKEMGGGAAREDQGRELQQAPAGQEGMPGGITINLNLCGGQQMAPPPQSREQQGQQKEGDVQGHGWVIYANRYWAYRNQYWAYRNHY
jgi:hypothetical protein